MWVHPSATLDVYVDDIRVTITHPQREGAVTAALEHCGSLKGLAEREWGMALVIDKAAGSTLPSGGIGPKRLRKAHTKVARLHRLRSSVKSRKLRIITAGVVPFLAYGAEVVGLPESASSTNLMLALPSASMWEAKSAPSSEVE